MTNPGRPPRPTHQHPPTLPLLPEGAVRLKHAPHLTCPPPPLQRVLSEQALLQDPQQAEAVLAVLPGEQLRERVRRRWASGGSGRGGAELSCWRWEQLKQEVDAEKAVGWRGGRGTVWRPWEPLCEAGCTLGRLLPRAAPGASCPHPPTLTSVLAPLPTSPALRPPTHPCTPPTHPRAHPHPPRA